MNTRLKFVLITVATLVAVATTASLGMWQLSRAAQKQARQTAMDAQTAKPPLTATSLMAATDPMTVLHQRAKLRGSWAPPSTMVFLENRPMAGRTGFVVVMPFLLEGGQGALVVQRGWVPRSMDDRTRVPKIDTLDGVIEIEGRMALPPSDLYALGDSTGGAIRQNLTVSKFAAETGLQLLPLTLQQTGASPEGLLREWPVLNMGIDKNYGYAAQWFGMAALFSLLYLWFQIFRRFFGSPKDPKPDV